MTLLVFGSAWVTTQCFPVMNLRRPPDLGGSETLSGVPTKTQVPTRSLASLVGSAAPLPGSSPAPTESVLPACSTRADARNRAVIRMPRRFVDFSIGDAAVYG